MGWPDDHTLVPYRGKPMADGPRYKIIGNGWALPCVQWIAKRIINEISGGSLVASAASAQPAPQAGHTEASSDSSCGSTEIRHRTVDADVRDLEAWYDHESGKTDDPRTGTNL